MRFFRIAAVAVVAGLVLAACSGGDSPADDTATTETSTATATETSSATETATETETSAPSTELTLTAPVGSSNTGFAETELSAPADTPFTIVFKNDDTGIPHNVQIFEGTDTAATPVWAPEGNALINGVAEETYEVPALAAGTYTYNCFAHPATMVGTLTVA
jgi:plastocyanin